MSEAGYYWPTSPGEYLVSLDIGKGDTSDHNFVLCGAKWRQFGFGSLFSQDEMIEAGYLGVFREAEKPKPAADPVYYWPLCDEIGERVVSSGLVSANVFWNGSKFRFSNGDLVDESTMKSLGWLGVIRDNEKPIIARVTLRGGGEHKPPKNALMCDPDDGNAMVAQQALDEWRAVKQQPKAADWACKWAVDLCKRLGAR